VKTFSSQTKDCFTCFGGTQRAAPCSPRKANGQRCACGTLRQGARGSGRAGYYQVVLGPSQLEPAPTSLSADELNRSNAIATHNAIGECLNGPRAMHRHGHTRCRTPGEASLAACTVAPARGAAPRRSVAHGPAAASARSSPWAHLFTSSSLPSWAATWPQRGRG